MVKKILIIEDDRILLETASKFLTDEGYAVFKARDGVEGIKTAEKELPDLIFCDIYMPVVDGYEVFAKLQSNYSTSQIPFIFLTSKSDKEDIRHGMNLGADDYITKPFNVDELKKTIITRLEKFEKNIRLSEMKYRVLFELSGDAIFIVKPPHGEIVDANRTSTEMLGFTKEELLKKNYTDLLTGNEYQKSLRHWEKGNKKESLSNIETTITSKTGYRIPVLIRLTNIEINKEWMILLIVRNITEIREKEHALKESEERHRELVENTGEGLGVVDVDEVFTYANPAACEFFGLSYDELMGKNLMEFVDPAGREEIRRQTGLRKTGEKSIYELNVIRPDGERRWIVVTATPRCDTDGNFIATFGIFRDITKRKLYEKELIISKEKAEESDRLKTSILANISHELRTPLNGILGFAEILREELKDTDYSTMAENIHASGRRLMLTLNSIITLSQLESGRVSINLRDISLQDVIGSVVKSMQSLADEKQITISSMGIRPMSIQTDEHLLKQLLRQILDNSIKFTERGGVTIETTRVTEPFQEWSVIRISDTGIGIAKDYFELIFQEFRQVSEGFGREYQGSGIGLTICKKIIDLLKGRITLESQECIGSAFSIWLPCEPEPPSTEKEAPEKQLYRVETKRPRRSSEKLPLALLVEDNKVNKDLTEYFLRSACKMEHALNGETCLVMAKAKQYAIILMDINLGSGKTGIETVRELRKLPGYEKIPIIAVTGYAMANDKEKLLEEGCTHYIPKPFDQATLLGVVEQALSAGI
ncbi:MAG: response regulator [bacterium]